MTLSHKIDELNYRMQEATKTEQGQTMHIIERLFTNYFKKESSPKYQNYNENTPKPTYLRKSCLYHIRSKSLTA